MMPPVSFLATSTQANFQENGTAAPPVGHFVLVNVLTMKECSTCECLHHFVELSVINWAADCTTVLPCFVYERDSPFSFNWHITGDLTSQLTFQVGVAR